MKRILLVFVLLLTLISFVSCETKDTNNTKQDVITFGVYPQKEVVDNELIDQLKQLSPNAKDRLEFNEKEYILVDGKYYELAPIEWEAVLIGEELLYITKDIIDAQVFLKHEYVKVIGNSESIKPGVPEGIYSNNYQYSDLREWLNYNFLNYAFTEEEKSELSKINYDGLSDYVYTLSKEETVNLKTVASKVTDYAIALGCDVFTEDDVEAQFIGNGISWLRNPNEIHRYRVSAINAEGVVHEFVDCYYTGIGVRPVIKLK